MILILASLLVAPCHTWINGKYHPEICFDCSRGHWPNVEQVPCSEKQKRELVRLLKRGN